MCSFFTRHFIISQEESILQNEETRFMTQVKLTSVTIDGSRLSFQGRVIVDGQGEEVVVRHTFASEREKEQFMTSQHDTFIMEGTVNDPSQATNFFQFDYSNYLNRKQIFKTVDAKKLIPVEGESLDKTIAYQIDTIRHRMLSFIDKRLSPQTALYIKALLFADKREFDEPVNASFKELGIVHLLSISGLHIHFLIESLKKALNKARLTKETSRWVLVMLLPVYGCLTGFGTSVFRAIGQSWLKVFGEMTHIKWTTLDRWSLVFCVSLLINPFNLLQVGFQLSYFMSLIIILLVNQSFYKSYNQIKAYIVLSFVLFVGSLPILSYHFFEFSWGVLFLNSLYIPFLSLLFLPMLVLLFFLSLFFYKTRLFTFFMQLTEAVIHLMEETTFFISEHTSFSVIIGRLPTIALVSTALFFILLLLLIEQKNAKPRFYAFPIIGILISVFSVRYSPFGQVHMIDVGQGESILIKEPWGKGSYLIDTGGLANWNNEEPWEVRQSDFNVGEDIVVPVLKSQGVHRIETVIITHSDWDHYGGLDDLSKHLPIKAVLATESTLTDPAFLASLQHLQFTDTDMLSVEKHPLEALPEQLRALDSFHPTQDNKNNESLILIGLIGEYTWLFTGDLEKEGEQNLLKMYPNMTVDVLKVGHHGSQTSTTDYFLDHLSPTYAWISAGNNNSYGHPHSDVMARLEKREIEIYQTNVQGAIQYRYTDSWLLDKLLHQASFIQTKNIEKE